MTIHPFKGRSVDFSRPVQVYRNLNKIRKSYDNKVWWSIRQDGLVVGHATHVCLTNAKFVVSYCGWYRYTETGKRNIHAWVNGFLYSCSMYTTLLAEEIKYDRINGKFVCMKHQNVDLERNRKQYVHLGQSGCSAC